MNVPNSKARKLLGQKKFIYGMTALFSRDETDSQF
jgi:hypothetical protein